MCIIDGCSFLYVVCINMYESIVWFLLKELVNVDLCDNKGKSVFYYVFMDGNDSIVLYLFEYGVNINLCFK